MDEPFAYAIFPIICLVIVVFVASILFTRRRRRRMAALQNGRWPQDHGAPRNSSGRQRRTRTGASNRWAPWSGTRNDEGLNELGEAPPPYDGKSEGDSRLDEVELRDLEMNRPPQYPAEPDPAIVRNTRLRWV